MIHPPSKGGDAAKPTAANLEVPVTKRLAVINTVIL
ncbi:hypothetical protein HDC33_000413 [Sporosarcina sp. JAI121]|nr:hypothetical protein [Sporosarcina sp. JAI121]